MARLQRAPTLSVKANDEERRQCETEIVLLTEGDLGSLKKGPYGVACAVIQTLGVCRVAYTRVVRAHEQGAYGYKLYNFGVYLDSR